MKLLASLKTISSRTLLPVFFLMLIHSFSSLQATSPIFITSFGSAGAGNGQFSTPTNALYIESNGYLYISDYSNTRLQLFNTKGVWQSNFGFNGSQQLAYNANLNRIYGTSGSQHVVVTLTLQAAWDAVSWGSLGTGNSQFSVPQGIAINPSNDNVYVSDYNNNRVLLYDKTGTFISKIGAAAQATGTGDGQFNHPVGMSFYNNQLYVTDANNNRIQVFDASLNFVRKFNTAGAGNGQLNTPVALIVHPDNGNIYVSEQGNSRLQKFNNSFSYIAKNSLGAGGGQGVAINRFTGQVFATNYTNTVNIYFDPDAWTQPGTSELQSLILDQALTLNTGYNLSVNVNVGTSKTTLAAGSTLTLNGGTFLTELLDFNTGTLEAQVDSTVSVATALLGATNTAQVSSGKTLIFSNVISGAAGKAFVKTGVGTLKLTGVNTYTGATTVSAGTLIVNGSVAGNVLVSSGATLRGTGTIAGNVTGAGTVAPGQSPGSDLSEVIKTINVLPSSQQGQVLNSINPGRNNRMGSASIENAPIINKVNAIRLATLRDFKMGGVTAARPGLKAQDTTLLQMLNLNAGSARTVSPVLTFGAMEAAASDNMHQQLEGSNGDGRIWLHTFGQYASQQQYGDTQQSFKAKTGGVIVGLDRKLSQQLVIGAGVGLTQSLIRLDNDAGNSRIRSYYATFYGSYAQAGWHVDLSLTTALNLYKNSRRILLPTESRMANSSHLGIEAAPHIDMGYEFALSDTLNFEPFVAFDYVMQREKGYSETGANSLTSQIKNKSSSLLRSEVGTSLAYTMAMDEDTLILRTKLSYVHKKGWKSNKLTATFVGQSQGFMVEGSQPARQQLSPGFEADFSSKEGNYMLIRYNGEFDRRSKNHEIMFKIGKKF